VDMASIAKLKGWGVFGLGAGRTTWRGFCNGKDPASLVASLRATGATLAAHAQGGWPRLQFVRRNREPGSPCKQFRQEAIARKLLAKMDASGHFLDDVNASHQHNFR